jgi:phage shock protein PspC (stress-responsive transcriptional regulator)
VTSAAPPATRFFDGIRSFGLVRPGPGSGRMVAGVAAGLARRLNLDPIVVRAAFIVLTFVGGLGAFLYGLGWLFLPQPDGRMHAQRLRMAGSPSGSSAPCWPPSPSPTAAPRSSFAAIAVAVIGLLTRNRYGRTPGSHPGSDRPGLAHRDVGHAGRSRVIVKLAIPWNREGRPLCAS